MRFGKKDPSIQIVVERRGYGSTVWYWRLLNEEQHPAAKPLAASTCGFRSAEEAYASATSNLKRIQHAPRLSNASTREQLA